MYCEYIAIFLYLEATKSYNILSFFSSILLSIFSCDFIEATAIDFGIYTVTITSFLYINSDQA